MESCLRRRQIRVPVSALAWIFCVNWDELFHLLSPRFITCQIVEVNHMVSKAPVDLDAYDPMS